MSNSITENVGEKGDYLYMYVVLEILAKKQKQKTNKHQIYSSFKKYRRPYKIRQFW